VLHLRDLMQRDVLAVAPDLTLRELVELFAEQEVSGAPVISGGKVVGVVSTTDIYDLREDVAGLAPRGRGSPDDGEVVGRRSGEPLGLFADEWEPSDVDAQAWLRATRDQDWDILDAYTVAEIMTRDVVSQPSNTTVKKAARYMLEAGIHRVLVIDGGVLQGIVTTTDIVRAVAQGRLKG
jgi:CBS domain-containing protein